ncbi:MAG: DUF885 domain-containing protein [Chryseolinea sp.]
MNVLKYSFISLFLAVCCFSCKKTELKSHTPNADSVFQNLSHQFIKDYLTWRPRLGTYLGLHEYDGKVGDYSKSSIEGERVRLRAYEDRLMSITADSLSPQMNIDYRLLLSAINQELFSIEDLKIYWNNPMTYAGLLDLNIYIQRDFASIEDRMRSIIAIEKKAPVIYAAAKENLSDSLARPHVETAIIIVEGTISFLKHELTVALQDVKVDSLQKSFAETNTSAIAALADFAQFLRKEKLPRSNQRYAIGVDKYKKMLLYNEMITTSPQDILAMGMDELKKEQALFAEVAKTIDPKKKPIEVFEMLKKEHPTAENLLSDSRKNLEQIREFLVDKNVITIPSEVRVSLVETPTFARATGTASMDTPGPFEKKATQAFYYVTPVEKNWSLKQKEEWLSMFNYFSTDIVSIHEAYPGHYVQFLHLNASKATDVEKIFMSYAFVEGWAHYTEKMMIEEGFGKKDSLSAAKYHLAQLDESLIRLARLCVSIKMHCEGMTIDEGTKFIEDNAYYEHLPAHQESLRGSFDPGYLSYTLGKLQILKLREDYKKQEGQRYSLKKFHDELLSHGAPPLEIMREIMIR